MSTGFCVFSEVVEKVSPNIVGVFTGPKCENYLAQYIHRAEESIADRVTQLVARCGWPDALTQLADSQSSTPSQQSKTNSTSVLDTPEETWLFNLAKSSILKKRRALHLQRTPNPQHLSKNGVSTTYLLLFVRNLLFCLLACTFWVYCFCLTVVKHVVTLVRALQAMFYAHCCLIRKFQKLTLAVLIVAI